MKLCLQYRVRPSLYLFLCLSLLLWSGQRIAQTPVTQSGTLADSENGQGLPSGQLKRGENRDLPYQLNDWEIVHSKQTAEG